MLLTPNEFIKQQAKLNKLTQTLVKTSDSNISLTIHLQGKIVWDENFNTFQIEGVSCLIKHNKVETYYATEKFVYADTPEQRTIVANINRLLNKVLGKSTSKHLKPDYHFTSPAAVEERKAYNERNFAATFKNISKKTPAGDLTQTELEKRADQTSQINYGCDFKDGKCKTQGFGKGNPMCCCKHCASNVGYLNYLPDYAVEEVKSLYDNMTGFWREGVGCTIPRKWRSLTCLSYNCSTKYNLAGNIRDYLLYTDSKVDITKL